MNHYVSILPRISVFTLCLAGARHVRWRTRIAAEEDTR